MVTRLTPPLSERCSCAGVSWTLSGSGRELAGAHGGASCGVDQHRPASGSIAERDSPERSEFMLCLVESGSRQGQPGGWVGPHCSVIRRVHRRSSG